MGFLKNLLRNAISEGISKGVSSAISSATEKAVQPKAEEYANKVADTIDEAAKSLEDAANNLEAVKVDLEQRAALAEDFVKEWNETVPEFPVWCFGGTNFCLSENGTTSDGYVYHIFDADDATEEGLKAYTALLRQEGFISQHDDGDQVLYKEIGGGEYLVFSKAEAFNAAPHMSFGMWHTKDTSEFLF